MGVPGPCRPNRETRIRAASDPFVVLTQVLTALRHGGKHIACPAMRIPRRLTMTPGPNDFNAQEILSNEPRRRRVSRPLIIVAGVALVATTGAGVATAAALSPTPTASAGATATTSPSVSPSNATPAPGPREPRHGWGPGRLWIGGAVHGEFVVPGEQGQYVTVAIQVGDVTAVDQKSITVKSVDGYTKTYAINGDTRVNAGREGAGSVKTGNKVAVSAAVSGNTATAKSIRDLTAPKRPFWHDRGHGPRGGGHEGWMSPTPSAGSTT